MPITAIHPTACWDDCFINDPPEQHIKKQDECRGHEPFRRPLQNGAYKNHGHKKRQDALYSYQELSGLLKKIDRQKRKRYEGIDQAPEKRFGLNKCFRYLKTPTSNRPSLSRAGRILVSAC